MPRLSDVQRIALADWWTLAQTAAYGGFTATDTVTAASDLARSQFSRSLTFGESGAIATLFGYARRMASAGAVFRAAGPADEITGRMIATPPWARPDIEMAATPTWHATFQMTFLDQAGEVRTELRTSVFQMTLPATMGELADAIAADAQVMADKYQVTLMEVSPHELLAV
jgi:hypothetical protein